LSGALGRIVGRLWLRRTLRFRITSVATAVTLVVLLLLAVQTSRLIGPLLVSSADAQLQSILDDAVADVRAGKLPADAPVGVRARVLDTAGLPKDDAGPAPLNAGDVRTLKAGTPVLRLQDDPPLRWLGTVATAPDGSQRLVVVGTTLTGYFAAQGRALDWLVGAALLGSAAVGIATWFSVRSSLRPVERLRSAATRLPPGKRLPLPTAHDELRSLAAALNGATTRATGSGGSPGTRRTSCARRWRRSGSRPRWPSRTRTRTWRTRCSPRSCTSRSDCPLWSKGY
jgi:HAMP domain-containing protein